MTSPDVQPWYRTWFESPWYMKLYRHRTEDEARQAVALVHDAAHIPEGARILDLCCGYGRHAMALAEQGYDVVGLDQSAFLISRAQEEYAHPACTYVVGDMRGPYPHAPYNAIVNFFTSFGYFDNHADHQQVFTTMFNALVPGGVLIMDFLNAEVTRRTLVAESMQLVDGATVIQERRIEEPVVKKTITISNPCCYEVQYHEQVWLYTAHDLMQMATEAGFTVETVYGSYSGSPFDPETSPRCILIAHRPANA